MFNYNYYPEDIAETLGYLTSVNGQYFGTEKHKKELENVLYNLLAICQNKYNDSSYRIMYRTLENICYLIETGSIK